MLRKRRSASRFASTAAVAAVACFVVPGLAAAQPCVDVTATGATICGVAESRDGYEANQYLGIQYATAGRFENPTIQKPSGTVDATEAGSVCAQAKPTWLDPKNVVGAEDCLFLNVWTPTTQQPQGGWPVLVFIHGGAFIEGGSTSGKDGILFDGIELSNLGDPDGIVVVTFNYRLGPLGFLAMKDGSGTIAGNYGFLDQLAALHWVQSYIAAFGGDPSRVTIAGQSAGASSVGYHLFSSSESAGLFAQAILESDPLGLEIPSAPGGTSAAATATVAEIDTSDCAGGSVDVVCLQTIDYEKLTYAGFKAYEALIMSFDDGPGAATNLMPWGPILDGTVLKRQPLAGARTASAVGPAILGTNHDEGAYFQDLVATLSYGTIGPKFLGNFLASLFGGTAPSGLPGEYTCTSAPCGPQFARLVTDYVFTCPTHYLASQKALKTAYAYQFDHAATKFTFPPCPVALDCPCKTEVCHSAELPFVWDGATAAGGSFTSDEQTLSDHMASFWGSFVVNGDPNKGNGPWGDTWSTFGTGGGTYLALDLGSFATTTTVATDANCDYWDQQGYPGVSSTGAGR